MKSSPDRRTAAGRDARSAPRQDYVCLTYCALPHNGRGWPQSCVSLLAGFSSTSLRPVLVLPRLRTSLPATIGAVESLAPPLSLLPWRYMAGAGLAGLERRFRQMLDAADPATTVAYFWPGTSRQLVQHARDRGIMTVREMINTFQGTAKTILDQAYRRLDLPPAHVITTLRVEEERRELALYDYICASNAPCEESLVAAGVEPGRIIRTSFGWSPARFTASNDVVQIRPRRDADFTRALFVGTIGVRKGVPELLAAWDRAGLKGELTLVGEVESSIKELLNEAINHGSVKHVPYTGDIASHYRTNDIFVFPTLEEGGPQVTVEAGGCGMPVITTPMGAGRLIRDGVNGLVVPPGDATSLAVALRTLSSDIELQRSFSQRIAGDAQEFAYDLLGAQRASSFIERLLRHQQSEPIAASA